MDWYPEVKILVELEDDRVIYTQHKNTCTLNNTREKFSTLLINRMQSEMGHCMYLHRDRLGDHLPIWSRFPMRTIYFFPFLENKRRKTSK